MDKTSVLEVIKLAGIENCTANNARNESNKISYNAVNELIDSVKRLINHIFEAAKGGQYNLKEYIEPDMYEDIAIILENLGFGVSCVSSISNKDGQLWKIEINIDWNSYKSYSY